MGCINECIDIWHKHEQYVHVHSGTDSNGAWRGTCPPPPLLQMAGHRGHSE